MAPRRSLACSTAYGTPLLSRRSRSVCVCLFWCAIFFPLLPCRTSPPFPSLSHVAYAAPLTLYASHTPSPTHLHPHLHLPLPLHTVVPARVVDYPLAPPLRCLLPPSPHTHIHQARHLEREVSWASTKDRRAEHKAVIPSGCRCACGCLRPAAEEIRLRGARRCCT